MTSDSTSEHSKISFKLIRKTLERCHVMESCNNKLYKTIGKLSLAYTAGCEYIDKFTIFLKINFDILISAY